MGKKILFINNLGCGGAERVVTNLFKNEKFNNQFELWLLDNHIFYDAKHIKRIKIMRGKYRWVRCLDALYQLSKLKKCDFVQCHLKNNKIKNNKKK